MNWYFEVQGVSKGPFPEEEFAQMARRGDVPADSLIWRPGLKEWGSIRAINPAWIAEPPVPKAPAAPPTKEPAVLKKAKTTVAPKTAAPSPANEDLPVIEAAVPTESATPASAPVLSKLKPQAPTPADAPAQTPAKGGLLKRMFGLGGKKK